MRRLKEILEDSTEWPFPPVVIDSDRKKGILLEGGHRTKAAYQSDWPAIPAIDVAGARVIKTTEGLETYDFKRKRWKRVS